NADFEIDGAWHGSGGYGTDHRQRDHAGRLALRALRSGATADCARSDPAGRNGGGPVSAMRCAPGVRACCRTRRVAGAAVALKPAWRGSLSAQPLQSWNRIEMLVTAD